MKHRLLLLNEVEPFLKSKSNLNDETSSGYAKNIVDTINEFNSNTVRKLSFTLSLNLVNNLQLTTVWKKYKAVDKSNPFFVSWEEANDTEQYWYNEGVSYILTALIGGTYFAVSLDSEDNIIMAQLEKYETDADAVDVVMIICDDEEHKNNLEVLLNVVETSITDLHSNMEKLVSEFNIVTGVESEKDKSVISFEYTDEYCQGKTMKGALVVLAGPERVTVPNLIQLVTYEELIKDTDIFSVAGLSQDLYHLSAHIESSFNYFVAGSAKTAGVASNSQPVPVIPEQSAK